jgi:hypothetical protein
MLLNPLPLAMSATGAIAAFFFAGLCIAGSILFQNRNKNKRFNSISGCDST